LTRPTGIGLYRINVISIIEMQDQDYSVDVNCDEHKYCTMQPVYCIWGTGADLNDGLCPLIPCPHLRLQSPNSATVTDNGDCRRNRRKRRQSPNSATNNVDEVGD